MLKVYYVLRCFHTVYCFKTDVISDLVRLKTIKIQSSFVFSISKIEKIMMRQPEE